MGGIVDHLTKENASEIKKHSNMANEKRKEYDKRYREKNKDKRSSQLKQWKNDHPSD